MFYIVDLRRFVKMKKSEFKKTEGSEVASRARASARWHNLVRAAGDAPARSPRVS